jgi:hypothetical protein
MSTPRSTVTGLKQRNRRLATILVGILAVLAVGSVIFVAIQH